jgi:hypothetical protein
MAGLIGDPPPNDMVAVEPGCGFTTDGRKPCLIVGIPLGARISGCCGKNCDDDDAEAMVSKDDVFKMLFVLEWDLDEAAAVIDTEEVDDDVG